jgi:hypothetical protein
MRIKKHKAINQLLSAAGFFSLVPTYLGEWEMLGAFWMVIICMLPGIWLALGTSYLSCKLFCALVFIPQIVTVPAFYLNANNYAFNNHRPFGFGAFEALPAFVTLGLFLWIVAFLVKLTEITIGSSAQLAKVNNKTSIINARTTAILESNISKKHVSKNNALVLISILFLISVSLPVKFWMFNMDIGLVGAPPPQLPYRISGILFYTFNYMVPIMISYLYIKSKRSSLLVALTISTYALMIGFLSVSKGVLLLTTVSIIAFAWLDRRWLIFSISVFLSALGVLVVTTARKIVHVTEGNTVSAFTDLGGITTLKEVFSDGLLTPELFLVFIGIANRFEGFQSMFLASQFNPDILGGAWSIFFRVISFGRWGEFNFDAIHLEYLGYTIPYGLYGVGATYNSWMMLAANKNILMVLPFAAHAALIIVILERSIMRASRKYPLSLIIGRSLLFLSVLWFYTAPADQISSVILTVSIIFSLFPAVVVGRRLKYLK